MPPLLPASALVAQLEPYKKLLGILVRQDCISLAVSNPYLNLAEPLGGLMLRDGRLSERALQRLLSSQQQDIAGYVVGCEVANDGAQQQHQQQQQQQQSPANANNPQQPQQTQQQQHAVHQLQAALAKLGWQGGWYGNWCQTTAGAVCSISTTTAMSPAVTVQPSQEQLQQQTGTAGLNAASEAGICNSSSSDLRSEPSAAAVVAAAAAAAGGQTEAVRGSSGGGVQQEQCSLGQQFLQHYLESLGSLNTFG